MRMMKTSGLAYNMENEGKELKPALSPEQKQHIRELVELSPPVIHSRVRRDAISASEVLHAYSGTNRQVLNLHQCDENNTDSKA